MSNKSTEFLLPGEEEKGQMDSVGLRSQDTTIDNILYGTSTNPSSVPGATQGGQMVLTAGGGPQVRPANQQQMTAMQVPYSANQPPPCRPEVTAGSVDLRPPSFIVMTLIVTFICFFLNITTLIFGIPAIILSIMSAENKKKGEYRAAKKYSKIVLGINIANIVYTAGIALVIVSGVLGSIVHHYHSYPYYK